jgi:ABC-type multidrug transport system fused ATPase/permease subunit
MDGISALCVALLIYYAAPELFPATPAATGVTLGLLFAFIDYLQRVFVPIREFSAKLATIQRAVASLERIYSLLDEPAEARSKPGDPDPLAASPAACRSATCAFATARTPARSCAASPSTSPRGDRRRRRPHRFGQDQPRAHPHPHLRQYEGSVQLHTPAGAVEVREVVPDALRSHVLMVQQDVFLFNDDVAQNVSLGEPQLAGDPAASRPRCAPSRPPTSSRRAAASASSSASAGATSRRARSSCWPSPASPRAPRPC